MANKHAVTVNGVAYTRISASRAYTHAILGKRKAHCQRGGTWEVVGWAGSGELAGKAAQNARNRPMGAYERVEIVANGATVDFA